MKALRSPRLCVSTVHSPAHCEVVDSLSELFEHFDDNVDQARVLYPVLEGNGYWHRSYGGDVIVNGMSLPGRAVDLVEQIPSKLTQSTPVYYTLRALRAD